MRKLILALLLLFFSFSLAHAGQGAGRAADTSGLPPIDFTRDTLSLPPAYLPELPGGVRSWLAVWHYRIP